MRAAADLSRSQQLSTHGPQSCVPKPSPLEHCPRTGPTEVWGVPWHAALLSRVQPLCAPGKQRQASPSWHTQGHPCPCASRRVQGDGEGLPIRSDPGSSRLPAHRSAKPHPQNHALRDDKGGGPASGWARETHSSRGSEPWLTEEGGDPRPRTSTQPFLW